jgi:hypothetical protein
VHDTLRTLASLKTDTPRPPQDEPRHELRSGKGVAGNAADNSAPSDADADDAAATLRQTSGRTAPPATPFSETAAPRRMDVDARPRETQRAVIFASGPDARSAAMRAQDARLAAANTVSRSGDVARAGAAPRSASPTLRRAAMLPGAPSRMPAPRMTPAFFALPTAQAAGVSSHEAAQHAGLLRASSRDIAKRVRLKDGSENGWEFAARGASGPAHKNSAESAGDSADLDDGDDAPAPSRDIMDEYRTALMDDGADSDLPESS